MKRKTIKSIAVVLSVLMVMTFFTGCGVLNKLNGIKDKIIENTAPEGYEEPQGKQTQQGQEQEEEPIENPPMTPEEFNEKVFGDGSDIEEYQKDSKGSSIKSKADFDEKLPRYLMFTAEEDDVLIFLRKVGEPENEISIETSYDGVHWEPLIPGETLINLKKMGDRIYMRGDNRTINEGHGALACTDLYVFVTDGEVTVDGNIMSLLDKTCQQTEITAEYCFCNLFRDCEEILTPPDLPATKLSKGCYNGMFRGCKKLMRGTALPATKLADLCYLFMFKDCESIKSAPVLVATELADSCYVGMFEGCYSLTSVKVAYEGKLIDEYFERIFDQNYGAEPHTFYYNGAEPFPVEGCFYPGGWDVVKY